MKNISPPFGRVGFTLIELLVVIAIIAALAALIFPVMGAVQKRARINVVRSEMAAIESMLDSYKAQYSTYPPGSGDGQAALWNQLYYELSGVTNVTLNSTPVYQTLDNSASIGTAFYANMFNVGGVLNSAKNGGDEAVQAKNFLHVKSSEIGLLPITNQFGGFGVKFLITSVGGPDASYQPMGFPGLNPFRYVAPSPTNNNANSYDLWVQLVINGKTNLVCNWKDSVQINSPWP